MNQRIENLKEYILDKKHHQYRRTPESLGIAALNETFHREQVAPGDRAERMFAAMLANETPVILPGETILLTRTITRVPDLFTEEEWKEIRSKHYIHESGYLSNLSANYRDMVAEGFDARKAKIDTRLQDVKLTKEERHQLEIMRNYIELSQTFLMRYAQHADEQGLAEPAAVLRTIAHKGATTFREALQLLRAVHYLLWISGTYHNTLGRFDQYMYPYMKSDIEKGALTKEEAYDLLLEFFLACNRDSDLYPGMQQGDNGQSMVLGGRSPQGEYLFNDLSEMCLRASYDLALIDPKINLRVDSKTPLEIFELGSQLTKRGLGFPQYNNDDVVIPGLIRLGYSREDAHDYVVAACWEFIIPGYGMEIPNIDAVSFADIVRESVCTLSQFPSYDEYYRSIEAEIHRRFEAMAEKHKDLYIVPAPFMSLIMNDTIENARDITLGGKYNNFGIHGTGIATAVDSLTAIKKHYFEERKLDAKQLEEAIENNFEGAGEVYELLRHHTPKMGQDDDYADKIAVALMASFDKALAGTKNERGGLYRAGTGTAMYYIGHSAGLGATPDGRKAGEVIPANYSPSMYNKQIGPVSVIKSFTKPDLTCDINGGPLTIEFDESVFRNEESVQKLAMLVKSFITLGGHQLQLNTINLEKLLDAKKHPERYRNLIVRVWGWSGYFVELDEVYQNHVIQRLKYAV